MKVASSATFNANIGEKHEPSNITSATAISTPYLPTLETAASQINQSNATDLVKMARDQDQTIK